MNTMLSALFIATSVQFNLPDGLLESLCYVESTHKVAAVNYDDGGSDSLGVCQIKLKTARWMGYKGDRHGLMDPKTNIFYAGKYLAYQIKRYKSVDRGVIAYNMGNAKNLTTSHYQRKVFGKWRRNTK